MSGRVWVGTRVSACLGDSAALGWLELAICALGFGGLWAKCVLLAREAHHWLRTKPFSPSGSAELLLTGLDFGTRYNNPPAVARGAQCCPLCVQWGQSERASATCPVPETQSSPAPKQSSVGFPVVDVRKGTALSGGKGAS